MSLTAIRLPSKGKSCPSVLFKLYNLDGTGMDNVFIPGTLAAISTNLASSVGTRAEVKA
jgi:hypothetical protein